MKKGLAIGIVIVIIVVVILGIYFYSPGGSCGVQGQTINFANPLNPNECCDGLKDVNTQDSVSVADECYWSGTESGAPILTCSNCGNGICEDVESVCGCAEDCIGKDKSDYDTVQQFCNEGYERYCNDLPDGFELDLCNLC